MKTITAKLPDNLADAISAAAEDNKASKSDIIRDILSRYLIDGDKMPESVIEPDKIQDEIARLRDEIAVQISEIQVAIKSMTDVIKSQNIAINNVEKHMVYSQYLVTNVAGTIVPLEDLNRAIDMAKNNFWAEEERKKKVIQNQPQPPQSPPAK